MADSETAHEGEDEREEKQSIREEMDEMRHNAAVAAATFEYRVELEKNWARLLRARFEGLVESGFSEQQAMSIVTHRGLNC